MLVEVNIDDLITAISSEEYDTIIGIIAGVAYNMADSAFDDKLEELVWELKNK